MLPTHPTFALAEEYVKLQTELEPESWINRILLVNDMTLQPVILYGSWILGYELSLLAIVSVIVKVIEVWVKWGRYQVLRDYAKQWVFITKLVGGPFISCNDPRYHVFVYAEAIERLRLGLSTRGWSSTPEHLRRVAAAEKGLKASKHL
jgi:hypothetical protein